MSSSETDGGLSEREFEQFLEGELFGPLQQAMSEEKPPPEPELPEEEPIVVTDEREQPEEIPSVEPTLEERQTEGEEEPEEEEEEEDAEDENVVWAKKKYGRVAHPWAAKVLRDNERHISQLAREKSEAQQLAVHWYDYAQQVENDGRMAASTMPLSPAEEEWIENSLSNPLEYARAALREQNQQLYNGVLRRVAEENPLLSSQIGTQIQLELQQEAQRQQVYQQPSPSDFAQDLRGSFERLGIDAEEMGEEMAKKIGDLGNHHPYVQAIKSGHDAQRDLGVQAVYDLVRVGRVSQRRVRDDARAQKMRREGELRREAAGVVTGAPHTPPQQEDPFLAAMTEEWKARGQWTGE